MDHENGVAADYGKTIGGKIIPRGFFQKGTGGATRRKKGKSCLAHISE